MAVAVCEGFDPEGRTQIGDINLYKYLCIIPLRQQLQEETHFFCMFSKKFSLSLSPVISPTLPRACAFRIPPIDGSSVTEFSCLVPPHCNFSVWLDIRLNKADGPPETSLSASELIHVLCTVVSCFYAQ